MIIFQIVLISNSRISFKYLNNATGEMSVWKIPVGVLQLPEQTDTDSVKSFISDSRVDKDFRALLKPGPTTGRVQQSSSAV